MCINVFINKKITIKIVSVIVVALLSITICKVIYHIVKKGNNFTNVEPGIIKQVVQSTNNKETFEDLDFTTSNISNEENKVTSILSYSTPPTEEFAYNNLSNMSDLQSLIYETENPNNKFSLYNVLPGVNELCVYYNNLIAQHSNNSEFINNMFNFCKERNIDFDQVAIFYLCRAIMYYGQGILTFNNISLEFLRQVSAETCLFVYENLNFEPFENINNFKEFSKMMFDFISENIKPHLLNLI